MATKEKVVHITPLEYALQPITIVGLSPLITHAWSEKAKRMMLEKQTKERKGKQHDIRIPVNDFMSSLYWLTERPELGKTSEEAEDIWDGVLESGAKFGFPVGGIKQSIAAGAFRAGVTKNKVSALASFFLMGNTENATSDLAEIVAPLPDMREDMVRIQGKSDLRYRPEFKEWKIPLIIKYNPNGMYSIEQILDFINYGGFAVGIGEWRPEKNGQFGMYELKTE